MISTFMSRDKSTGVLLTGEKGSGKTMLSKNICNELASKCGVPTIVINAPWHGDKFNTLIQSIQQPCVVLFDEFEKVYDSEQQQSMLTLLDGIYSSKKLFVLTCNDKWRIDTHMRNRPGRIFYYMNFKGLDENFIREYCQDNLNNKEHIDKLVNIASVFSAFNFDMLKATVEEMNRYDETPAQALTLLNVKAEFDSGTQYEVEVFRGDAKAQLAILQHVHGWTAKSEVALTGSVEISITAALEAARARVLTVLEDYGTNNQILTQAGTGTDDRDLVITDCRQPVEVRDDGVSLGADGDTTGEA
jgi:SpoVK/Ycf46/Vps4 family AAA+-type ATPase